MTGFVNGVKMLFILEGLMLLKEVMLVKMLL